MLNLIDLLIACRVELDLNSYKVHLADNARDASGYVESPLAAFHDGTFKQWQEWQSRKNFNCNSIVSLIKLCGDSWLFAGVHRCAGAEHKGDHYEYQTQLCPGQDDLIGRVIVHFKRTRSAYRWGEPIRDTLRIQEYRPQKLQLEDFPGFDSVCISHEKLKLIISQVTQSWHGALANIKGVYLIADTNTGKLYVGCANGNAGIWDRWASYAVTGHGGNVELMKLIGTDKDYAYNFQYSILEIADSHRSDQSIESRESHWKKVLLSRPHGYNKN